MSDLALAVRQIKYENKSFWRNPASAFFTFAFPLIFLVIFNVIFGSNTYTGFGKNAGIVIHTSQFYTPTIIAFSVITACYTNIAMSVTFARDQGVLKRIRGTPLPSWAYLFGRIAMSMGIAALLVVIVTTFGRVFYSVHLPPLAKLPAFLITLAVGAAAFSALGLAVTGFIPNADSAPAIVNASILPLLFISDVFIPLDKAPKWLATVSGFFPIKHFSHAMLTVFNPLVGGSAFRPHDLMVMAAWGVFGIVVALRKFSWEPRV